jgi:hypothetical protein
MRWPKVFGRFWYDFIVGDSIVLAIGGPGALTASYALARSIDQAMLQLFLPAAVVATLVASLVWRSE